MSNSGAFVISSVILTFYIYRLKTLNWDDYKWQSIVMNIVNGAGAGWVAISAVWGEIALTHWILLTLPSTLILTSFTSWRHGQPPVHALKGHQ